MALLSTLLSLGRAARFKPTVLQGVGGVSCDMASHLRLAGFGAAPLTPLFRRGCERPLGSELPAVLVGPSRFRCRGRSAEVVHIGSAFVRIEQANVT
jgi:hypothetical protein